MAKYVQVYEDLLNKIQRREIAANAYLPSESELMAQYDCSRDTIRKSLNLLLEKGYIVKEKGKGSKVLDVDVVMFPFSGITSFKELAAHSTADIRTDVIDCITQPDPFGQSRLLLNDQDPVTKVERVRSFDGERVILDLDYLNPAVVPGITPEIAGDSLFEYIEDQLHLPISFAKKEITVEPVSTHDRELLDLRSYDMLVVIRSYTYLEDATLFGYTVSKHRPDKFRFLDFAKRSKL